MMQEKPKAVVLLSGGLDSATVLAMAMAEGYECCCLSFAYGQRQQVELERAKANVARQGITNHLILRLDLDAIGGSALTTDTAVPKGRSQAEMNAAIPITYVPGERCIESKSLKLYLFSYRGEPSFMETLTNRILDDLSSACKPRRMAQCRPARPRRRASAAPREGSSHWPVSIGLRPAYFLVAGLPETGVTRLAARLARCRACSMLPPVARATPMRRFLKLSGLPNRRRSAVGTWRASATPS